MGSLDPGGEGVFPRMNVNVLADSSIFPFSSLFVLNIRPH